MPTEREIKLVKNKESLLTIACHPEEFFRPNEVNAMALSKILKFFFEYSKWCELDKNVFKTPLGPLDKLLVDGTDVDSIWAQVQLRNVALLKGLKKLMSRIESSEDISLAAELSQENENVEDESDGEYEIDDDDALENESTSQNESVRSISSDHHSSLENENDFKPSKEILKKKRALSGKANRDGFFDYDDMDQFADETEDLDDAVLEEIYGSGTRGIGQSEGETATFKDLFTDVDYEEPGYESASGEDSLADDPSQDSNNGQDNKISEEELEGSNVSDDENEAQKKSTPHTLEKQKMKMKISELEKELLQEKPWALRGEIMAKERPENSLLEAVLDVERTTRVAPTITIEKTASLEDVIKARILEDKFDDVAPKNIELPTKKSDLPDVSMEKDKDGLAVIYEKEYLKRTLGVEEDDPQKPLKDQLKADFVKLGRKLDALCNFHFQPKPPVLEMEIRTDLPAIAMEDILPVSMSTADSLAPEEIYAKKRGRQAVFLTPEEMDRDERHRARLAKKRTRNKSRKMKTAEEKLVSKANPGLNNPYEKKKLLSDIQQSGNIIEGAVDVRGGKDYTTSSKFFGALQNEVKEGIRKSSAAENSDILNGKGQKRNRSAAFRL